MQDSDRRLDALACALGWVVLISAVWLTAAWLVYLGRITGSVRLLPDAWWPRPELHLIFIAIAKLMVVSLIMAWIGVLLYRRRLRRA